MSNYKAAHLKFICCYPLLLQSIKSKQTKQAAEKAGSGPRPRLQEPVGPVPLGPLGGGSGRGSKQGGHTCPAPRAGTRTNMAKDRDTAVAEGEMEPLGGFSRRAPRFWGQWGAAWKERGCPGGSGGKCWPPRDPRVWGPRGWAGRPAEGGSEAAPPRRDAYERPLSPHAARGPGTAARPGERGVGPRPEGAMPRLAPPGRSPRPPPA